MIKTLGSIESTIRLKRGRVGVSDDGKVERNGRCKVGGNKIGGSEVDGNEIRDNEIEKNWNTFKSKKLFKFKKTIGYSDFLTPKARLTFTKLRQVLIKSPILYYYDLKHYI